MEYCWLVDYECNEDNVGIIMYIVNDNEFLVWVLCFCNSCIKIFMVECEFGWLEIVILNV